MHLILRLSIEVCGSYILIDRRILIFTLIQDRDVINQLSNVCDFYLLVDLQLQQ